MRKLIMHYHFFKNAGTSVDAILKHNFEDYWAEKEFDNRREFQKKEIKGYIISNESIVVLASHTALFPLPVINNTIIFPIVFVRHPLTRLKSAYSFEQKQEAETYGAVLAKKTTFEEYLKNRIGRQNDFSCQNFQARRLAPAANFFSNILENDSLAAIEELPFVGVVEEFEKSIECLERWLKQFFPNFSAQTTRKNITDDRKLDIDERLYEIRDELGRETFELVKSENEIDIGIHKLALDKIQKKWEEL